MSISYVKWRALHFAIEWQEPCTVADHFLTVDHGTLYVICRVHQTVDVIKPTEGVR